MVAVPSDSRRPKSCLEVGGILRLIELIFEFGVSIENPQNQKIHVRFVEKTLKKYQLKRLPKMSRIHRETADLQRFYDHHQNEGFETHFLPPPNPEQ